MDTNQALLTALQSSNHAVFFGGAGVSTESGIPDFRSADGLYSQKGRWAPEEIISHDFFFAHTEEFWAFYRSKMMPLEAQPNAAHRFLAELEQRQKLTAVVTQNIDGLHQKAGSRRVLELHGSIYRNHCLHCGKAFAPEALKASAKPVPRCSCGGLIKPDVVLYGEPLPDGVWEEAVRAIRQADLMIVAGTSLTVYPAAGLLQYFRGKHLVLINRDATPYDSMADLVIHDSVGKVLASLS